ERDGRQVHRRAVVPQRGQADEQADGDERGDGRGEDERHLRARGRAQRVAEQAQLQPDDEPSHDSPAPSLPRAPTRAMNACCRVLPPRTSSVVPVTTIRPALMTETWSQICSTSSITWLENSTVDPEAANRASSLRITSAETGSTPSRGSSRNSTCGLWMR